MKAKVRWGIMGTAKIARTKLMPAIVNSLTSEITAVASRSAESAEACAREFGISTAYGSYEALLADPNVDAIYNPLPNHLHTQWSIRAINAGKHVLCEKPLGLNVNDAGSLVSVAAEKPQLKVMEAFMYRFHPQWHKIRDIIQEGLIGDVQHVYAVFTYCNLDPNNVRNQAGIGGGALMDVGCYCISVARFLYGEEPVQVFADMDVDPKFGVDRLTVGTLRFPSGGRAQFRCAMQNEPAQTVVVSGDKGELVIETPYYQAPDVPVRLHLTRDREYQLIEVAPYDHYQAQVEAFAKAIQHDLPVPTSLRDALANMRVIDQLVESHKRGGWVSV